MSLAITSTVCGFIEAALLFLVVSWSVAVAAGEPTLRLALGPVGDVDATLSQTVAAAAGLVVLALLVAYRNAATAARIWSRVTATLRKDLLGVPI